MDTEEPYDTPRSAMTPPIATLKMPYDRPVETRLSERSTPAAAMMRASVKMRMNAMRNRRSGESAAIIAGVKSTTRTNGATTGVLMEDGRPPLVVRANLPTDLPNPSPSCEYVAAKLQWEEWAEWEEQSSSHRMRENAREKKREREREREREGKRVII